MADERTSAAEPERARADSLPPLAEARRHRRLSLVWILPLLAAAIVAYVTYQAIVAHGPSITITFKTAEGLRVEQTQVKYKAVALGTVQEVELSEGGDHVVVHIDMNARAEPLLTEHTQFWVVRPRLSAGAIAALQAGLETLVSGSYIELDPGSPGGEKKRHFRGLEKPPAVRSGEPGTTFVLHASQIGSLGPGSQVLHRQVTVGEILGYDLDEKSGELAIRAFVRAPYDQLVRRDTCFWNVSGVDVGMSADGLHVEIASVRTMLSGGVAFQTPERKLHAPRAQADDQFRLYATEAAAEVALHGQSIPYVVYFHDSIQGLSEGSPVKLFGVQVGNVTDLRLVLDPEGHEGAPLAARVGFVLQPQRALEGDAAAFLTPDPMRAQVANGLRVMLESENYLTGEKALSLSYVSGAPAAKARDEGETLVVPGDARSLSALSGALSDVATRLNKIPFERIGKSLDHTLASVDQVVSSPSLKRAIDDLAGTLHEAHALTRDAQRNLSPALSRLPTISAQVEDAVENANAALASVGDEGSDFQRKTQRLLTEVADMARSVRLLSDFLERNPEALLRGRGPRGEP